MARELLLLRHGKSDWSTGLEDFKRPLKDRGKRAAQRMGVWLAQQQLVPDLVISSPAERAKVTAEKCCKAMETGKFNIQLDKRIYSSSTYDLLQAIKGCSSAPQRVMLVGHNPALLQLLLDLTNSAPETPPDGKIMPTATLARLSMPDNWQSLQNADAQLLQLIRAANLPEKFPYPSPCGKELRDRPAYYYTQSSVIAYRFKNGNLEVLVVGSSKKKHWVIPKGIAEPDLSPQESAGVEAFEEAGVTGQVAERAIGSYTYPKWGSHCTVTVYPMQVTSELPANQWEENHRGRQWVSPEKAATLLKQKQLRPMLLALKQQLAG